MNKANTGVFIHTQDNKVSRRGGANELLLQLMRETRATNRVAQETKTGRKHRSNGEIQFKISIKHKTGIQAGIMTDCKDDITEFIFYV